MLTVESVVLGRRIDITLNNEYVRLRLGVEEPAMQTLCCRLAIRNTQLIREYMRVLPRLKGVIDAFVLWHKQRCRSWGSYLIALLAIRWHMVGLWNEHG